MGSEMCIRDRVRLQHQMAVHHGEPPLSGLGHEMHGQHTGKSPACLLYTSDAADERSSVDLGGRRIIKKKNKTAERSEVEKSKLTEKTDITAHIQEQQRPKRRLTL